MQTSGVAIDFSRRFMPEHLTPLFHTACYARLTREQRLRYNQLHSFYLNEQTIFFESAMAQHILRAFTMRELPASLATGLETFIAEEAAHSEMFRQLNRLCWPDVYSKEDFYFVRLAFMSSICLRKWVKHARMFPFFLWILLIQEERALFYAREFLKEAGELEPNFVAVQRRHLADEAGHILWDQELLNLIWPQMTKGSRIFNARLFAWMMGEYFTTPKRSGLRVVAELIKKFPALQPLWPELRTEMLELSRNERFNLLCYSREVTPKTFARFDQWLEFRPVNKAFPSYQPLSDISKSLK